MVNDLINSLMLTRLYNMTTVVFCEHNASQVTTTHVSATYPKAELNTN